MRRKGKDKSEASEKKKTCVLLTVYVGCSSFIELKTVPSVWERIQRGEEIRRRGRFYPEGDVDCWA